MVSFSLDTTSVVLTSLGTSLVSLSVLNSLSCCPVNKSCSNTTNENPVCNLSNCPVSATTRTGLRVGLVSLAAGSLLNGVSYVLH